MRFSPMRLANGQESFHQLDHLVSVRGERTGAGAALGAVFAGTAGQFALRTNPRFDRCFVLSRFIRVSRGDLLQLRQIEEDCTGRLTASRLRRRHRFASLGPMVAVRTNLRTNRAVHQLDGRQMLLHWSLRSASNNVARTPSHRITRQYYPLIGGRSMTRSKDFAPNPAAADRRRRRVRAKRAASQRDCSLEHEIAKLWRARHAVAGIASLVVY